MKEEIEILKKCIANQHEKMLINVMAFEEGGGNLEKLLQYLESCNEINMNKIRETIERMKHIKDKAK